MLLEPDLNAAVRQAEASHRKNIATFGRLTARFHAYRRLLIDPATDELSADALIMFADLAESFGLNQCRPMASADELRAREAFRAVIVLILSRLQLPADKLRRLTRQIDEFSHDEKGRTT